MYGQKVKNPNNTTLIIEFNKFRNLLNILIKKAKVFIIIIKYTIINAMLKNFGE